MIYCAIHRTKKYLSFLFFIFFGFKLNLKYAKMVRKKINLRSKTEQNVCARRTYTSIRSMIHWQWMRGRDPNKYFVRSTCNALQEMKMFEFGRKAVKLLRIYVYVLSVEESWGKKQKTKREKKTICVPVFCTLQMYSRFMNIKMWYNMRRASIYFLFTFSH